MRQDLTYNISALVVDAMIDFWQLSIAQKNIRTSKRLLQNTRNVRSITIRKRRLGLAEAFEVKQWDALISQAKTRLEESNLRYDNLERALVRTLNLSLNKNGKNAKKLKTHSKLSAVLPADLNFRRI